MVELMRSGKSEKVRMDAAATLLALAGVRPTDGAVEKKPTQGEAQRPAVLLNLFLGGGSEPVRVVEGQARPVGQAGAAGRRGHPAARGTGFQPRDHPLPSRGRQTADGRQ